MNNNLVFREYLPHFFTTKTFTTVKEALTSRDKLTLIIQELSAFISSRYNGGIEYLEHFPFQ